MNEAHSQAEFGRILEAGSSTLLQLAPPPLPLSFLSHTRDTSYSPPLVFLMVEGCLQYRHCQCETRPREACSFQQVDSGDGRGSIPESNVDLGWPLLFECNPTCPPIYPYLYRRPIYSPTVQLRPLSSLLYHLSLSSIRLRSCSVLGVSLGFHFFLNFHRNLIQNGAKYSQDHTGTR